MSEFVERTEDGTTVVERNAKGEVRRNGVLVAVLPSTMPMLVFALPGGVTQRFFDVGGVSTMNPDVEYIQGLNESSPVAKELQSGHGDTLSYYTSKWSIERVARALVAIDRRADLLRSHGEEIFAEIHRLGRAAEPVPFDIGKKPLDVPAPNWMLLDPVIDKTVDGDQLSIGMGRWYGAPVRCGRDEELHDPEARPLEPWEKPYPAPTAEEWAAGHAYAINTNAFVRMHRARRFFEAMFVRLQLRELAELAALGPMPKTGTSKRLECEAKGGGSIVTWWRSQETRGYGTRREWFMFLPLEIVR